LKPSGDSPDLAGQSPDLAGQPPDLADAAADLANDSPDLSVASAQLAVDDNDYLFDTVVGTPGAHTFHWINLGGVATHTLQTTLSGDLSFQIVDDHCSGHALAPKDTCAISVALAATPAGTFAAELHLSDSPFSVAGSARMSGKVIITPPSCVAESDAQFCARLGKSCESVSDTDNCGTARTANCGTCTSPSAPACVANVCSAPVCGTRFASAGTPMTGLNIVGQQSGLLGISGSGNSILYLRGHDCLAGGGGTLLLADQANGFDPVDITGLASLATYGKGEESMTLSSDGLTIIGVAGDGHSLYSSSRSALGKSDFASATDAAFATLNAALPAGGSVSWPLLSADGLAFYYQVGGATDSARSGTYESVRSSTKTAFPAAHKLAGVVQSYGGITGISADRLTLFVSNDYGTTILARNSLTQPFVLPASSSPPMSAWRIVPLADCSSLIGTSEPGGCQWEQISVWNRQ
jgi:hypothetical protein